MKQRNIRKEMENPCIELEHEKSLYWKLEGRLEKGGGKEKNTEEEKT